MYALISFVIQRKGGHPRSRGRWRKLTWLTLVGGVGAGVGLISWCWLAADKNAHRLKLAGFLGTVYAEGWPDRVGELNFPPDKSLNQGAGGQPVYALLHPETPISQMAPEKKLPKPRPSRVAKKGQTDNAPEKSGKTAKVAKAPATPAKKDKVAAKSRAKKFRSVARNRPARAG